MRISRTRALALLLLLGSSGCGGCGEKPQTADRLWGRDRIAEELAIKSKETIDAYALEERPEIKNRVLQMKLDEVVARLGFLEYQGVATFHLSRNGHHLRLQENTKIEHGLHGSWRVLQKDEDGTITRETVFNNGVVYVRNGPGKLRVQGAMDSQHKELRDEAFQALSVYTSYYGPRCGLKKVGAAQVAGRGAAKYELVLLEGSPLITVPGMKGSKKPVTLSGTLMVDEQTGAPLAAKLEGVLSIPGKDDQAEPGKLELSLDFTISTTEGKEVAPGEFIPTIKRHPVDLDPLAFLDGGTRTSTVIGGKRGSKIPVEVPEENE